MVKEIEVEQLAFKILCPAGITTFTQLHQNLFKFPFDFKLDRIYAVAQTNTLAKFAFKINERIYPTRSFEIGGTAEVSTVTTVADVAGSLNSTYFNFDVISPLGVITPYYCWMNVGGAGVDPAPAGRTGAVVAFAANAAAAVVAAAIQLVIDALANITCTVLGAVLTLTNDIAGSVDDVADGVAPTGFAFAVTTQGVTRIFEELNLFREYFGCYHASNLMPCEYDFDLQILKDWNLSFYVINTHTAAQYIHVLFQGHRTYTKLSEAECPLAEK